MWNRAHEQSNSICVAVNKEHRLRIKEQLDGWKHTHTLTDQDTTWPAAVAFMSRPYTWPLPSKDTLIRRLQVTLHVDWGGKKRKEQNTRATAVRGQIGFHQRWKERLRCERGALIGSLSASTLVGFEICSLLQAIFLHLSWQQPDLRVQTQGEWRALPPLSLCTWTVHEPHQSHTGNMTPPPQLLHLNCIPIMSANNILPLLCSLLARCPKQWENQGYGGGETRKMNARKMKVDQYGCPRMWKGGLEL